MFVIAVEIHVPPTKTLCPSDVSTLDWQTGNHSTSQHNNAGYTAPTHT